MDSIDFNVRARQKARLYLYVTEKNIITKVVIKTNNASTVDNLEIYVINFED